MWPFKSRGCVLNTFLLRTQFVLVLYVCLMGIICCNSGLHFFTVSAIELTYFFAGRIFTKWSYRCNGNVCHFRGDLSKSTPQLVGKSVGSWIFLSLCHRTWSKLYHCSQVQNEIQTGLKCDQLRSVVFQPNLKQQKITVCIMVSVSY